MNAPLQIEYRGMTESDELSRLIRRKASGLERFYRHVGSCRVVVEQPHRRGRPGEHFHVRVEVTVPGAELVTGREPPDRREADVRTALAEAFAAIRRQLQDYARKRRGQTKPHATTSHRWSEKRATAARARAELTPR